MIKRAMSAACVCVPMSAMAEPAHLSGRELGELLPGATIQIDAPLGYKLPVRFGNDGTMTGEAGDLAFYLGSPTDTGKWWVRGDQVCNKWSKWLESKLQCMRLRKDGRILHWSNQDGDSGTATITVMAPPRPAAGTSTQVAAVVPPPALKLIASVPEGRKSEPAKLPDTPPAAPKPVPQALTALPPPSHVAGPVPVPVPCACASNTALRAICCTVVRAATRTDRCGSSHDGDPTDDGAA